jgi:hypothetical protein
VSAGEYVLNFFLPARPAPSETGIGASAAAAAKIGSLALRQNSQKRRVLLAVLDGRGLRQSFGPLHFSRLI